jgi:CheY-like chemotaxis protein
VAPDRPAGLIAMVIENDEPVRAAMSALLEGWGVSVLDVPGAEEALALLEDIGIAPDVVLADYHLDGATGLDAIAAIRERHGQRPAFLITADRSPELAALCRRRQVPLLSKPVGPARLRALLGSVLPSLRPAE